jgi:PadR family transcriptional regulator PadR
VTAPDDLQSGLPRGWLRPCLLLQLAEQPAHGYDLLEGAGALGLRRLDAAGLYRALRAMEQEGLVRSEWEPSTSGPARRTYTLTAEGRDGLDAWAGALADAERLLGQYRRRYRAVTATAEPAVEP